MIEVKNKVASVSMRRITAVNCNEEVDGIIQRSYGKLRIIKVIPFENLTLTKFN